MQHDSAIKVVAKSKLSAHNSFVAFGKVAVYSHVGLNSNFIERESAECRLCRLKIWSEVFALNLT